MNDEPKNTTISGNKLKDAPQQIHPNNVKNNKASNGEISNLSVSDKHDSSKTLGEQEFAHASNSGSNGNLIIDQNKDGGTKEAGDKRNSNHTPRNHFTRSRNPKSSTPHKAKVEQQPKLNLYLERHVEAEPTISIDACATIMAELDSRSYHRSLIQDANNVMQRILQPMSLPWTHKVIPVARNIPCDIDEMIDVVTADDGLHTPFENGNFGFGQFETGRLRSGESVIRLANSSDNFRAATRRSTDPGIIEFSTAMLPSALPSYHPEDFSMIRSPPHISVEAHQNDDHLIKGETALRCFEAMQALKKRKIEQARSCVNSYQISVKINSSTSRSSIFTSSSEQRKLNKDAMLTESLEALLPLEVENGRRMSKSRAKITAEKLGSYNIRHGPSTHQSGKNSNRTPAVGRTRLVWTSRSPSDQPQRVSFTSLVTGQKLESGAQKRPRNIRVRIKIDGEIWSGRKIADHGKQEDYKEISFNAGMKLQASLECDQLVRNLLDGKTDTIKFPNFVPPRIECVPDSAGSIHVVCTSPGTILHSSVSPILKLAAKRSIPCCTVCWRSTEGGPEVNECTGCGLLAHIQCCLDPGESKILSTPTDLERKEEWKCSVCYHQDNEAEICGAEKESDNMTTIKKSKRKSRPSSRLKDPQFVSMPSQILDNSMALNNEIKCASCLLSGGAMSRISVEGELFWIHEICRIWSGSERASSNSAKNQSCALCGTNSTLSANSRLKKDKPPHQTFQKRFPSRCVVKCAAVGCHISVHPMCALVSSLTSQSMNESSHKEPKNTTIDDIGKAKKKDIELCSQYTLTFASVRGSAHSFGKDPGVRCAISLPVIFCGIHNPAREQSFHGLYPGGKLVDLNKTLKVPSCKE